LEPEPAPAREQAQVSPPGNLYPEEEEEEEEEVVVVVVVVVAAAAVAEHHRQFQSRPLRAGEAE